MKHSIRFRFTFLFLAVIAGILLATWGLNTWGLESFYRSEKVKDIEGAYNAINKVVMQAKTNSSTILSADGTDDYSGN